jgi:hypothetical protein
MTYAPDDLLATRRYLLATLDMHPGNVAADLDPNEVGIVGDPAHAAGGGYHEGDDDLARVGRLASDYSKRESARDRPGSNAASALDIGQFAHGALTLPALSVALVHACEAGDPRTRDVREVIYSPDGKVVHRFDALGIRSSGDDSHLFHTHLSFFRDSEGRRDRSDNILGLLAELIEGRTAAATTGGDGPMWAKVKGQGTIWRNAGRVRIPAPDGPTATAWQKLLPGQEVDSEAALTALLGPTADPELTALAAALAADASRDAATLAAIQALTAGGTSVDTAAVLARINTVAAEESSAIQQLQQALAAGAQREAQLRHDLAEALGGGTGSA